MSDAQRQLLYGITSVLDNIRNAKSVADLATNSRIVKNVETSKKMYSSGRKIMVNLELICLVLVFLRNLLF